MYYEIVDSYLVEGVWFDIECANCKEIFKEHVLSNATSAIRYCPSCDYTIEIKFTKCPSCNNIKYIEKIENTHYMKCTKCDVIVHI